MLKLVAIAVLFTVLGALAWVAPPHVLGKVTHNHPEVTWQWLGDGLWNLMPKTSMSLVFALGIVYGILNPRYFWISFFAAWWVCPFNAALDLSQYPKSHNLLPFELLFFAILSVPALVGGFIGRLIRKKVVTNIKPGVPTNT
jgi:hypothetical protein